MKALKTMTFKLKNSCLGVEIELSEYWNLNQTAKEAIYEDSSDHAIWNRQL